jgi:hypothetical protein
MNCGLPILVNGKLVGALSVALKYKADRDYDRAMKFLSIIATWSLPAGPLCARE